MSGPGCSSGRSGSATCPTARNSVAEISTPRVAASMPERLGQQPRVHGQLPRLAVEDRIARGDDLRQHAHGGAPGVAELVLEPPLVQRGARVIAERQQELVAELLEAALAVRAHDHAGEAVAEVHRDGDERPDLVVGGRQLGIAPRRRVVVAHDLVARQHRTREALRDPALGRVVLEALVQDHVEVAVPVRVLARDEQALLGVDQLDGGAQDQRPDVAVAGLRLQRLRGFRALELAPQLGAPLPLGPPGLPEALEEPHLLVVLRLQPPGVALGSLPVGALRLLGLGRDLRVASRPRPVEPPRGDGAHEQDDQQHRRDRRGIDRRRAGDDGHQEADGDRRNEATGDLGTAGAEVRAAPRWGARS